MSKATVRPLTDPLKLHYGVALAASVDTDAKLLAALQASNPTATMDDVAAIRAVFKVNNPKVQANEMQTTLQWIQDHYQKPMLDSAFPSIVASLGNQLLPKGYQAQPGQIVPDITTKQHYTYLINELSSKQLNGPFDFRDDLATVTAAVIDTATHKQLVPEATP